METAGAPHRVVNPADGSVVAEVALATLPTSTVRSPAGPRSGRVAGHPSRTFPGARASWPSDGARRADVHRREVAQCGKAVRLATEFDVPQHRQHRVLRRRRKAFDGAPPPNIPVTTRRRSGGKPSEWWRRSRRGTTPADGKVILECRAAGCTVVIKPAELTLDDADAGAHCQEAGCLTECSTC